jgi:FOG: HPt domain
MEFQKKTKNCPMKNAEKNIYNSNIIQNPSLHLTKIKNDFVSFLLKDIKTHLDNVNEANAGLLNTALTQRQIEIIEKIKNENAHSAILTNEILSFLDIDNAKFDLAALQIDIKDYFDIRRNNNFSKNISEKYPLKILFFQDDNFNRKFIKNTFEHLGYAPDFSLRLDGVKNIEYDIVFIDLAADEELLKEQSDVIYAYFNDKKRPQIIALASNSDYKYNKSGFAHSIDGSLVKPVKINDLVGVLENTWEKLKIAPIKAPAKYFPEAETGTMIKEDQISFIQEIQTEEDIVFFIELIDIFIIETPKLFKIIREAISRQDFEKIQFCGHKLRGSSLTMGIELFINIGLQLEKNARAKYIENMDLLVQQLEHKFVRVVEELEEIKDRYKIKYLGDIH